MIFHENRLLTDDSHVISYLIFVENWERCRKNVSSAAVVIGALRVNEDGLVQIINWNIPFQNITPNLLICSLVDSYIIKVVLI